MDKPQRLQQFGLGRHELTSMGKCLNAKIYSSLIPYTPPSQQDFIPFISVICCLNDRSGFPQFSNGPIVETASVPAISC